MKRDFRYLLATAVIVLSACVAPAATPEGPALLVAPDAQAREELLHAVSSALNGIPITLASDALTTTSMLVIERAPVRDASGQRLSGRELGKPERFTQKSVTCATHCRLHHRAPKLGMCRLNWRLLSNLVLSGTRCTLIHERSGQRFILAAANCRATP